MTPGGRFGLGLDSPLLLLRGCLASHPLPRSLPDGSDSSLVGVRIQNVSEARTSFPRLSARLSEEGGCFLIWHPQEAGAGVGGALWRRPRKDPCIRRVLGCVWPAGVHTGQPRSPGIPHLRSQRTHRVPQPTLFYKQVLPAQPRVASQGQGLEQARKQARQMLTPNT